MRKAALLLTIVLVTGVIPVAGGPERSVEGQFAAKTVAVNQAGEEGPGGWEVWLSDQADSADISMENPAGTYGSRIIIYESSDILAAPPGWYAENDPQFGPTVIEASDVFPSALEELGVNVQRLHGMLMQPPTHRYVNANFFGPGVGLVGIIDAEGQCTQSGRGYARMRTDTGRSGRGCEAGQSALSHHRSGRLRSLESHVLLHCGRQHVDRGQPWREAAGTHRL